MGRYQGIALTLLFLAGAVNFFDRSSLAVANTTVRAEMHLSGTEMGWLLSAFSLAYGLCQLPLVGMLHRIGTRRVLGVGLTVWSGAQLLTGFVPGFATFLGFRVMLGAGESPFYPAGVQTVREWFPAETRGRATAVMNASQTIGLAVAPPALTWMMVRIGWRHTFMGLGVAGLVVALCWFGFYRERGATQYRQEATGEARGSVWWVLLGQRATWGMMLGFSGVAYTNWLYTSWVPGYLQTARHLSLTKTGWLASIPFLFGAAGMMASGVFTDAMAGRGARLTTVHRGNLIVGMICSALCTLAAAHSETTFSAVGSISMALFFIHFAGTSGWGYAQSVGAARYVASLSALQNFAGFMLASAAPVVTGFLLDRTHSFTLSLYLCSGITLLGALSYATLAGPGGMQLRDDDARQA